VRRARCKARGACLVFAVVIVGSAGVFLPAQSLSSKRTIFADEFSGQTLDRAKWNVIVTGETVNDEQQAYVDSPETIAIVHDAAGAEGGALAIPTRYRAQFRNVITVFRPSNFAV
jgi:hypothetical protein